MPYKDFPLLISDEIYWHWVGDTTTWVNTYRIWTRELSYDTDSDGDVDVSFSYILRDTSHTENRAFYTILCQPYRVRFWSVGIPVADFYDLNLDQKPDSVWKHK